MSKSHGEFIVFRLFLQNFFVFYISTFSSLMLQPIQKKSQRHRQCIERRSLFSNSISKLYTKRLFQNSYQESVRYTSVTLRLTPSTP